MWSEILIILTAALGFTYIFSSFEGHKRDIKTTALATLALVILYQVNGLLGYNGQEFVSELFSLSIFSTALTFILMSVRRLKPEFARYPYLISFFPMLVIITYPLLIGNQAIISLVLQLLQLAALLALIFIVSGHFEEKRLILMMTGSVIFLAAAYLLFWPLADLLDVGRWLWQSLAAVSLPFVSYAVTKFFNKHSYRQ